MLVWRCADPRVKDRSVAFFRSVDLYIVETQGHMVYLQLKVERGRLIRLVRPVDGVKEADKLALALVPWRILHPLIKQAALEVENDLDNIGEGGLDIQAESMSHQLAEAGHRAQSEMHRFARGVRKLGEAARRANDQLQQAFDREAFKSINEVMCEEYEARRDMER